MADRAGPAVRLTRAAYEGIVQHALEERPFECCGLLAGPLGGPITAVYRAANAAELRGVRYEVAPRDILRITREIDDADLELLGIYHSHPFTRAYPSATDLGLAAYPVAYLIVSLADFLAPVVRAFTISDGTVSERPLDVLGV